MKTRYFTRWTSPVLLVVSILLSNPVFAAFIISSESHCYGNDAYSYYFSETAISSHTIAQQGVPESSAQSMSDQNFVAAGTAENAMAQKQLLDAVATTRRVNMGIADSTVLDKLIGAAMNELTTAQAKESKSGGRSGMDFLLARAGINIPKASEVAATKLQQLQQAQAQATAYLDQQNKLDAARLPAVNPEFARLQAEAVTWQAASKSPDYTVKISETAFSLGYTVKVSETAFSPDITMQIVSDPRQADLILVDGFTKGNMKVCKKSSSIGVKTIKVSNTTFSPDITVKLSETSFSPDYKIFILSETFTKEEAAALFAVILKESRKK